MRRHFRSRCRHVEPLPHPWWVGRRVPWAVVRYLYWRLVSVTFVVDIFLFLVAKWASQSSDTMVEGSQVFPHSGGQDSSNLL